MINCFSKTAVGQGMKYLGWEILSKTLTPWPLPTKTIQALPILTKGKKFTSPCGFAVLLLRYGVD